jgi:hypothetical protein
MFRQEVNCTFNLKIVNIQIDSMKQIKLSCHIGRGTLLTTLCDQVCLWLAAGRWFSTGTPDSFTNKIDRHDITEILLNVELNTE